LRSSARRPRAAVFRLDAGASIGGGHAVRCLALADVLSEDAWQCTFVVAEEGLALMQRLAAGRHDVVGVAQAEALRPGPLIAAVPRGCDLLATDHYGWSAEQERECRGWARRILAIDDLCDRPHDCDLLLDVSLERGPGQYAALLPRECRLLLGPGYALLRREFAACRAGGAQPSKTASPPRVFVNFGLLDARNFAEQTLDALERIAFQGAVDLVLGASSPHLARVQGRVRGAAASISLHVEPPDVVALMARADLAVGAAGGSVWERCCLGLPSLVVTAAANQEHNARTLAARGACALLNVPEEGIAPALADALARLLHDRAGLERMAVAARAVTDGRGARRVALAAGPEPTRHGGYVTLRRLTPEDTERTYRWQQHPDIRRYARNPRPPPWEEHVAWVARKLSDPGCVLDIIEHDAAPAGVVRLDRIERPGSEAAYEVSIYVAPELTGRGIGAAALTALRRIAPEAMLVGHVLPANAASHALFSTAGYVWQDGAYVSAPRPASAATRAPASGAHPEAG
jgi:UDP-2,4-diacetamido-2,4,6-trideoxy-beta-L-altropyranose hydrolase